MLLADLKKTIRVVPDYPKPGIRFYDLCTLFREADAFRSAIDRMAERFRGQPLDALAGIESRGFILASAMAYRLGLGLVMIRKAGKLPHETESHEYELEYGQATIEIHRDAVEPGLRIAIVDDVLATGGTAAAAGKLIDRLGGKLEGYGFLVELDFLEGRKLLDGANVFSLLHCGE